MEKMAYIRPFAAIRPAAGMEAQISALPYDVYNRMEAKKIVTENPLSFLTIDRAETSFEESVETYADCVYEKARELFDSMLAKKYFVPDQRPCYYLYELVMNGRTQTGLVACASIQDYENNVIMKHENTREEKEIDRIRHVSALDAQTGPIFLAYPSKKELNEILEQQKLKQPLFDFLAEDEVNHKGWIIDEESIVRQIGALFSSLEKIYIADGHHRCASAVKVGQSRKNEAKTTTGEEEYNFFLSVLFPDDQLMIMDYNRVVKDLNGLSEELFLERIGEFVTVTKKELSDSIKPVQKGEISLCLSSGWYRLLIKPEYQDLDPVRGLDVSILQEKILEKILQIKDPRTDTRIDFVGGIRGMQELEQRVKKDCAAAFAMYPPSIQELFAVSDAGLLMPPKSTWFEPKLRSGLFIHRIESSTFTDGLE